MKTPRCWLALILVLGMLTGCQTLSRGRSQWVSATSRPAGVRVSVDGVPAGTTPVSLKLTRRDLHVVRFELDGYRPVEIRMSKKRPHVTETILTSLPWAPIGAVAIGFPIFLVWNTADRPEGEWGGMGQAFVSAGIGALAGWALGTVVDLRSPSNYDLSPRALIVEMEPADGRAAHVIEMGADELRRTSWIRIKPLSRGEARRDSPSPIAR